MNDLIKVQADIINGVYEVEDFEERVEVFNDFQLFYSYLKSCSEDEVIGAELTEDQYILIDTEYGIH